MAAWLGGNRWCSVASVGRADTKADTDTGDHDEAEDHRPGDRSICASERQGRGDRQQDGHDGDESGGMNTTNHDAVLDAVKDQKANAEQRPKIEAVGRRALHLALLGTAQHCGVASGSGQCRGNYDREAEHMVDAADDGTG